MYNCYAEQEERAGNTVTHIHPNENSALCLTKSRGWKKHSLVV